MLDELTRRAADLAASGRAILGITGCPGCGKSTLAERLVARLDPEERWVVRVPMDGFHLANAALDRLGRRQRKGAIDTFDGFGYVALLRRIRTEQDNPVYAPGFERVLEQPIAASIAIEPEVRLVITEGNYLLSATWPWPGVRELLAEVWYVELDDSVRRDRLIARHAAFGKSQAEARRWVTEVDEPNARQVASTRHLANLLIDMADLEDAEADLSEGTGGGTRSG